MKTHLTHHIWAVGRNYADHAKEMKAEVPKQPFFFLKAGNKRAVAFYQFFVKIGKQSKYQYIFHHLSCFKGKPHLSIN